MKYLKVLPKYDNKYVVKRKLSLVSDELYTEKEYNKLILAGAKPEWFEPIETSKRNTYVFFGARFVINQTKFVKL